MLLDLYSKWEWKLVSLACRLQLNTIIADVNSTPAKSLAAPAHLVLCSSCIIQRRQGAHSVSCPAVSATVFLLSQVNCMFIEGGLVMGQTYFAPLISCPTHHHKIASSPPSCVQYAQSSKFCDSHSLWCLLHANNKRRLVLLFWCQRQHHLKSLVSCVQQHRELLFECHSWNIQWKVTAAVKKGLSAVLW